ncbi:hypothetical protein JRO89_XS03G0052700 [Xanthoceras sorbifolium]|uniref:Mediator complex subunit 15 KIX domain-containing protein n=1 Tax=Xanthoceras sorbifolium TaxID=99658 RepID=A0ABQ8I8Q5_9ROSI|nr:hypothetical protein JRO89_XS03G0052700 [Xanthoceras sorbifolium]
MAVGLTAYCKFFMGVSLFMRLKSKREAIFFPSCLNGLSQEIDLALAMHCTGQHLLSKSSRHKARLLASWPALSRPPFPDYWSVPPHLHEAGEGGEQMDTLKRHLPFSGQEGLNELKKIAGRFEEKIYTAATNQTDYLRKISLKMLSMESKSQNMSNSLPPNSVGTSNKPPDPGDNREEILFCVMQLQKLHLQFDPP